jgi:gamma-glutamylaminecyclotransferase
MTRVFVYGTLRAGQPNHRVLRGATALGAATTAEPFVMHDLGAFPAIVAGGATPIAGEVYQVDADTLRSLDHLEGYPQFYDRVEVALTDGTSALVYTMQPRQVVGRPIIHSGDWLRHIQRG